MFGRMYKNFDISWDEEEVESEDDPEVEPMDLTHEDDDDDDDDDEDEDDDDDDDDGGDDGHEDEEEVGGKHVQEKYELR